MGLNIKDSKLSQAFLDSIPKHFANSLTELDVQNISEKNNKALSFNFIFELKNIRELCTTSELDMQFILTLFKDLRYFWTFQKMYSCRSSFLTHYYLPMCYSGEEKKKIYEELLYNDDGLYG